MQPMVNSSTVGLSLFGKAWQILRQFDRTLSCPFFFEQRNHESSDAVSQLLLSVDISDSDFRAEPPTARLALDHM